MSSMNASSSAATRSVLNVRLRSAIATSVTALAQALQLLHRFGQRLRQIGRCPRSAPSSCACRRGGRRCARGPSCSSRSCSSRRRSSLACATTLGAHVAAVRGVLGRGAAGARAEHQQLGQRVRSEPIRAVDADARRFAGREQTRQRRGAVDVGMHAAHHVVHDRPHRDQLLDRIEVLVLEAQLAHERDLGVDLLLAEMPQIQVHDVAVRRLDRAASSPAPS